MPHSKDSYTHPGSDGVHKLANQVRQTTPYESLYRMMNSSLWMSQGFNVEAMMLTEAMANITQPLPAKKSNLAKIIRYRIVASLVLIGLALGVQLTNHSNVVEATVELHSTSQHQ